jgi:hypothetical protein
MNPSYKQFIFEDYSFDEKVRALELHYSLDGAVQFTERFHFDFELRDYDHAALDRACQALFFMAGVSYYKTYLAPEIIIKKGDVDPYMASFFSKTYQKGLGEFFFTNHLDPSTPIEFPHTVEQAVTPANPTNPRGYLIGLGGGKDSLVSVELLRYEVEDIATWSLNHRAQLTPLSERTDLPHYFVDREWDRSLLEHNNMGALNGHVPISAIIACVGSIVAVLTNRQDVVVSNEQSANEPTLFVNNIAINHQYSKSQEFELDYQNFLSHTLGSNVRYYSFLRPLSEVYIAELFSKIGFTKYKDVFSSCNRAFVHTSDHLFWDGSCSKCAFFFLAMTPFTQRSELEKLFSGKNLLLTPELEMTYKQLLGIEGDKPLDCIGDIKESRAAMRLAQKQYPELVDKYTFDIPEDYNYQSLGSHQMPENIYKILTSGLIRPQN